MIALVGACSPISRRTASLHILALRHVLLHEVRSAHRLLDGGNEVEAILARTLRKPRLLHDRPRPCDGVAQVLFRPRRGVGDTDIEPVGEAAYRPPGADHAPANQAYPLDVFTSSQLHSHLLESDCSLAAETTRCRAWVSYRFAKRWREDVGRGKANASQGRVSRRLRHEAQTGDCLPGAWRKPDGSSLSRCPVRNRVSRSPVTG